MTTAGPHAAPTAPQPSNFIREVIDGDLAQGRRDLVVTRFPPEPNGHLHIGHAKSICLNFGIARDYAAAAPRGTRCHLRMDDTNPTKEDREYIEAIQRDVRWLGFDWGVHAYHASDCFEQLYEWAQLLIRAGKAYVCDLSAEEVARTRGSLTAPGAPSPWRDRPADESLDLFARMRRGEFPNGSRTLRARIDMASPNVTLRDPVMYRILHAPHPHVGDAWCIYPMYDYAHGQCDWIEGISHSICTLEFEDHRPLYDWFLREIHAAGGRPAPIRPASGGQPLELNPTAAFPRQFEFARLNITHTMMSKRRLLELVREGHVRGWDDPRMPTLSGLRRRGYTPESIRAFCEGIGVARRPHTIELARLEHHVREDLNRKAPRAMAVLRPLRVVIENFPEGQTDWLDAVNNPEDPAAGSRKTPFTRTLYIERDDFRETPPPKYFRLAPGVEVRLRYAYFVRCTSVIKDERGEVVELRCTYDPATRGGDSPDGRKVKGTIHWVSADHALPAEVRLYDTLFSVEDPSDVPAGGDWRQNLNPDSLVVLDDARLEPSLAEAGAGRTVQFERNGYFCVDPDSTPQRLVFNRTVTLKDSWTKIEKKGG